MKDVTSFFSGASRRINNETEPKEHKTCALSHTRLWEAILGSLGESLILWKCPQFLNPPSDSMSLLSKSWWQIFEIVKKKTHNIHLPPQMTPDSKSVLEKQERAERSTFLFQMMSQRHRIKHCGSWAPNWLRWLSIRLLTTPPALILGVVSSSPGLGHGRGVEPTKTNQTHVGWSPHKLNEQNWESRRKCALITNDFLT